MILCDTGFIVGSLVATDNRHHSCSARLKILREQLVTTWPCVAEAMYLVDSLGGSQAVEGLRRQIETRFLVLVTLNEEDALRSCILMRQYADAPMDFADASLVVAAEVLNITRILTFDAHFFAYRINGKTPFEVLP
jgi:uncharacterized protein